MQESPIRLLLALLIPLLLLSTPVSAQDYQQPIDRLAEDVAATATKFGLQHVAILDFTDLQGNTQELGRFLAEELTTSLVLKERSFKTIDRSNLRSILQEQKLSMTGLQSPGDAKKLKIAGVDGLIRGTITPFGESIRLTLQVITVENGTIVGAARGTVPKTSAMDSLGSNLEYSESGSLDGVSSMTGTPKPGKALVHQDKNLRVTLKFFRQSSENRITAMFLVEALKDSSLTIWWEELRLIDQQGQQWERAETTGLHNHGTPLAAGQPLTASVVFQPRVSSSKPEKFTVLATIAVKNSTPSYISFSDVRLGI